MLLLYACLDAFHICMHVYLECMHAWCPLCAYMCMLYVCTHVYVIIICMYMLMSGPTHLRSHAKCDARSRSRPHLVERTCARMSVPHETPAGVVSRESSLENCLASILSHLPALLWSVRMSEEHLAALEG